MTVYCIQAGENGPVKIGHCRGDPRLRLGTLQTGCWLTLRLVRAWEGATKDENTLHIRFGHLRLRGDWFSFSRELLGDVGLERLTKYEVDTEADCRAILRVFGGEGGLARAANTSVARVSRWRDDGFPPMIRRRLRHIAERLELADADTIIWDQKAAA